MNGSRIERLAAGLEGPLLVTKPANVRYLSGLVDSSNAALLVDPAGDATLYTDFRYADAARALPERLVRADEAGCDDVPRRAARGKVDRRGSRSPQPHRVGGPASRRRRGRASLGPGRGAAGGEGRERARGDPSRRRAVRPRLRRAGGGAVRRPHRAGARLADRPAVPRARCRRQRLRHDGGCRGDGGTPAWGAARRADPRRDDGDRRHGLRGGRVPLGLHADVPHGRGRASCRPLRAVPAGPAGRARRRATGRRGEGRRRSVTRRYRRGRPRREVRARTRARRRHRDPRGPDVAAGVGRRACRGQRRHRRARDLPRRRCRGAGSRTSSSSRPTGASGSRRSPRI